MLKAQHLTFKGIPITGTLKEFTNAMVQKGFHHELTQDGVALFSGDFAGYKDCSIGVLTLHNQDMVNRVSVFFSDHDTWSSLQHQYEILKSLLTKKYGDPAEWSERFTSMLITSDYDKISALRSVEGFTRRRHGIPHGPCVPDLLRQNQHGKSSPGGI